MKVVDIVSNGFMKLNREYDAELEYGDPRGLAAREDWMIGKTLLSAEETREVRRNLGPQVGDRQEMLLVNVQGAAVRVSMLATMLSPALMLDSKQQLIFILVPKQS